MKTMPIATPDKKQVVIDSQKHIVALMKAQREIKEMLKGLMV